MSWAAAFASRPHRGLILLLAAMALFLAGGGYTTFWLGLLARIAATQIDAALTGWRTHMRLRLSRPQAQLWPWPLIVYLAWAAASWVIAAVSGSLMLRLTPAVTAATPFLLVLILLSALAHNIQRARAADNQAGAAESAWHQPALCAG